MRLLTEMPQRIKKIGNESRFAVGIGAHQVGVAYDEVDDWAYPRRGCGIGVEVIFLIATRKRGQAKMDSRGSDASADQELVTKKDLQVELAPIKVLLGVVMGGIIALIMKAFF